MRATNQYSFDVGFALSKITPVDYLIHTGYKVIHKTNFYQSFGVSEGISYVVFKEEGSNGYSILDADLESISFMDLVVRELDFLLNSNDGGSFTDMVETVVKLGEPDLLPIDKKKLVPLILRLKDPINPTIKSFKNYMGDNCLLSIDGKTINNLFQYNDQFDISYTMFNNEKKGYFLQNPNYPDKWNREEEDNILHITPTDQLFLPTEQIQTTYFKYRIEDKPAINHIFCGEADYLMNFMSFIHVQDYQYSVHFPGGMSDVSLKNQFSMAIQLANLLCEGFSVHATMLDNTLKIFFESEDPAIIKSIQSFRSQLYMAFEDTYYGNVEGRNLWYDHYIKNLCSKNRVRPGTKKQSFTYTILNKKHFATTFLEAMLPHFSINNLNINAYESV